MVIDMPDRGRDREPGRIGHSGRSPLLIKDGDDLPQGRDHSRGQRLFSGLCRTQPLSPSPASQRRTSLMRRALSPDASRAHGRTRRCCFTLLVFRGIVPRAPQRGDERLQCRWRGRASLWILGSAARAFQYDAACEREPIGSDPTARITNPQWGHSSAVCQHWLLSAVIETDGGAIVPQGQDSIEDDMASLPSATTLHLLRAE